MKNGRVEIDELYYALVPYMCAPDANERQLPISIPALAGGATATINFRCPSNSPGYERIGTGLEVSQLVFADSTDTTALADWTVQLKDPFGRYFSNLPIHVRNMFGIANYTALMREPFAFFQSEIISATLAKLSGNAVNVYPYLSTLQYIPKTLEQKVFCDKRLSQWQLRRQHVFPFWFTPGAPVSLTALQVSSVEKKLSDSHFEVFAIAVVSTGDYAYEITEVQSGQTLMNGRISRNSGLGTVQLPTILAAPYLIMRGSQLRFTFEDLSNGNNNIHHTLIGRKIIGPLKDFNEVEKSTCDIVPLADGPGPIIIEPVRRLR